MERFPDILELLCTLEKQTYSNEEILLVVENSKELLSKLKTYVEDNEFRNVKILFSEEVLGLSGARNIGVKGAKGELIAIIDDDAVPTTVWLEEAVKSLNLHPSIIGATGPAVPLWKDQPLEWLPSELQWIIGATTWWERDCLCEVRHAWGMNMAFKREAFETCGGFSESHGLKRGEEEGIERFPHEDVEFSLRVRKFTGKRIVYNPAMKVYHKVTARKMNLRFFAKHAYVQGFAKRMLKDLSKEDKDFPDGEDTLDREYVLLRRIFRVSIPSIFREIPRKPVLGLRKLFVTATILFFLAVGYYSPFFLRVKRKWADNKKKECAEQKLPILEISLSVAPNIMASEKRNI
jgi:GT2 family glycosyltransferase